MVIPKQTLYKLFPKAKIDELSAALEATLPKYDITSKERIAMFLAQYGHETGGFTKLEENLNYTSAERLLAVFPKYFKTIDNAKKYAGKPEAIANLVYANRMGNGAPETGHGYKYRGRAYCHLTGLSNYKACSEAIGIDLVGQPNLACNHATGAIVGAWFWSTNKLNDFADKKDVEGATKKINGGKNGLEERKALFNRCMASL
jgi:putative chitinase